MEIDGIVYIHDEAFFDAFFQISRLSVLCSLILSLLEIWWKLPLSSVFRDD